MALSPTFAANELQFLDSKLTKVDDGEIPSNLIVLLSVTLLSSWIETFPAKSIASIPTAFIPPNP